MKQDDFQDLLAKLTEIEASLSQDEQDHLLPELYFQKFQQELAKVKEHAEDILTRERTLKIGIIGQVKAGKSSFLNALVFDGEDILPQAATPMTAALTKIVYGEKAQAEVFFYTPQDWENGIERLSDRYQRLYEEKWRGRRRQQRLASLVQPDFVLQRAAAREMEQEYPNETAAHQLVEMSQKGEVTVENLPPSKTVPLDDVQQDLKAYVGADGAYTPFVKYLVLQIDNPLLKGLEIVDTPGLGDPILSRSQKTNDFLIQCDLVFLLSVTSQFLNRDDLALLQSTLPAEAIQDAVLVGTKFDQALLEDPSRTRISLKEAVLSTSKKIAQSARRTLERECELAPQNKVMAKVRGSLPPQFTSSILYRAAREIEQGKALGDGEVHILSQLDRRFSGVESNNPKFLMGLANISRLKKKEFDKVHAEKEAVIAERSRAFAKEKRHSFLQQLDDMQLEAEKCLHTIQTEDMDELKKKMADSQNAMRSMHKQIRTAFEKCGLDTARQLVAIKNNVNQLVEEFQDLAIKTDTRVHHYTETHWFKKDEHWTETEDVKFAEVSEVIGNINAFITRAETNVSQNLQLAIDMDKIRDEIKRIVIQAFLKSNAEFDEDDIAGPVELVLDQVTMPKFQIVKRDAYTDMIARQFQSGVVEGQNIHQLAMAQARVLGQIASDIADRLEQQAKEIQAMLSERGLTFNDDVKAQIEARVQLLERHMQDREQSAAAFTAFLKRLEGYKEVLRAVVEAGDERA